MSLNNVKFSRKIALCFAGVVTVVLVMSGVLYAEIKVCETESYASDRLSEAANASDDALTALVDQQNAVRGFVANGDEQFVHNFELHGGEFVTAIARLEKAAPDEHERIDALKAAATQAQSEESEQIAMRRNPARVAEDQTSIATRGRLTQVRARLARRWAITSTAKSPRSPPRSTAPFASRGWPC